MALMLKKTAVVANTRCAHAPVLPGLRPVHRRRIVAPRVAEPDAVPTPEQPQLTKQDLYKHALQRDNLTHSVSGEYEVALFFLFAGLLMLLPVTFPGFIFFAQWFHDTFPGVFGGMM